MKLNISFLVVLITFCPEVLPSLDVIELKRRLEKLEERESGESKISRRRLQEKKTEIRRLIAMKLREMRAVAEPFRIQQKMNIRRYVADIEEDVRNSIDRDLKNPSGSNRKKTIRSITAQLIMRDAIAFSSDKSKSIDQEIKLMYEDIIDTLNQLPQSNESDVRQIIREHTSTRVIFRFRNVSFPDLE